MTSPDAAPLRLDIAEGIATLTLTQAARGNPIDGPFCRAFRQAVLELWNEPGLRVVHFRGEGANFSFGGDIKSFTSNLERLGPSVREWTADLHMGLSRFWQLPVPVVAEVQGWAMGGAVALIAGCDVVIASEAARLGSAFAQLGFSCDSGSTVTLSARMGMARARRFVLLAEVLASTEALQVGLVDQVVPDAELARTASAMALRLSSGPTLAYGEIKRLFLRSQHQPLEAQLDDEALTLARMASTRDGREGISAMAEKRKPHFCGI
jgi:2-(1,2-epoxy-1,2-dihydrophenyl)acetyl-CoA isomerase